MKALTYEMANRPEMTQAVNELVRVGGELGLTASEFENAATIAMHMVRNVAMNVDLKGLEARITDCESTPEKSTKMPERFTESENFLIDTCKLPPELRWKISGMAEAANILNGYGVPTPPSGPTGTSAPAAAQPRAGA